MRIYITGYMGSGKSSLAPKLAEALGIRHIDLDSYFEQKYKISIPLFFEKYGEVHFRKIEHQLLKEISQLPEFVMATGGGTPCFHDNMILMNHSGITIYLMLSSDILCKRLKKSKNKRPLLSAFNDEQLESFIHSHLIQREVFYKQAQIILDNPSPDPSRVAQFILNQHLLNDEV